jgi:hypothetical protein
MTSSSENGCKLQPLQIGGKPMTQSPDAESTPSDEAPASAEQRTEAQYQVAVFAVPDERETLVPILGLIPGLSLIDARVRLHDLPGILPERLDAETADRLVTQLRSAGVNAVKAAESDVPRLEHRPTVHHLRCVSGGLEFVGAGGTRERVLPWEELALVSIGVVPVDRSHHEIPKPTAVIHAAPGIHGAQTDTHAAHGPEMWLVREEPFQAWRIDHLAMNYEYLGERISTSAAANFQLFAQDVANHAASTYLTPSARAYLQTRHAEEYRFVSRQAHAKAVQLHILLRRTMRDGS